jgi:hypothetical protein
MRTERLLNIHEKALRRLDEAAELLNTQQGAEFCLEVADTIRTYLLERFGLSTLPKSLSEFAAVIPGQSVQHQSVMEHFATQLNFAESLGFVLAVPDLEALRDSARHVIIRTTLSGHRAAGAHR